MIYCHKDAKTHGETVQGSDVMDSKVTTVGTPMRKKYRSGILDYAIFPKSVMKSIKTECF